MPIHPIDPNDPTEVPLGLRMSDVITQDPKTGERGEWWFTDAERIGALVAVAAVDRFGALVVSTVPPGVPLHIKPRPSSPRSAA